MKQIMRLNIQGNEEYIKSIRLAVDVALSVVKTNHPDFEYGWDECGYIDNIGGHHDSGVGWMPNGRYCGECSNSSCENCSIWKWELKKKVNKGE